MELRGLLKVIGRWLWLIIGLVVITLLALYGSARNDVPLYTANTSLQISTPDREDVAVIDAYAFTSDRDEITVVINNFLQIAKYDQVKEQTQATLGTDEEYTLSVSAELGADLVNISVGATTPQLAQEIATLHTRNAITYFGELRSLPLSQALEYFSEQLTTAETEVQKAEEALIGFQLDNGIVSLENEMELQQRLLEQLEEQRETLILDDLGTDTASNSQNAAIDLQLLELDLQIQRHELEKIQLQRDAVAAGIAATGAITTTEQTTELDTAGQSNEAIASQYNQQIKTIEDTINQLNAERVDLEKAQLAGQRDQINQNNSTTADRLTRINKLIEGQRAQLTSMALLEPQYTLLQADVASARERYDLLSKKYTETDLKRSFASQAMFIQVIKPPQLPGAAKNDIKVNLLLGTAASLGAGILLAFLLDYLFAGQAIAPWSSVLRRLQKKPASGNGQKRPKISTK